MKAGQPTLIIPPLELRQMIEKTAEYVARNGSQFEEIIYNNEKDNPGFFFLKLDNPYRAYYDKKVIEFAKSLIEGNDNLDATKVVAEYQAKQQKPAEEFDETKEEGLGFRFSYPQPAMSLFDSEIVKLTAFYAAMNGSEFLDYMTETEFDNPMFQFLKPGHRLFHFFTNLVESYIAVRELDKEEFQRLHENTISRDSIINRCSRRIELEKQEFKEKRRLIEETNKIQDSADYDWNNFVIVETITLEDLENSRVIHDKAKPADDRPEPQKLLGRRNINSEFAFLAQRLQSNQQQRVKQTTSNFNEEDDTAEDSQALKQTISFKPTVNSDTLYKCQFCGSNIPGAIFEEHTKQELKKREATKPTQQSERTFGHIDISENIDQMMAKRADMLANPQPPELGDSDGLLDYKHRAVPKPAFLNRK
jgi:hypothetical protein